MEKTKVAIIGGGLASIYSYFGALDAGYDRDEVEIFLNRVASFSGAVFMYESPILWEKVTVNNILVGTCDNYSIKQWQSIQNTSAHRRFYNGSLPQTTDELYDPAGLYLALWSLVGKITIIGALDKDDIEEIKKRYSAVICTFPSSDMRKSFHVDHFVKIPIYESEVKPDVTNYTVIYNGLEDIPWIRKTIAPGRIHTEYPHYLDRDVILDFENTRNSDVKGALRYRADIHPMTLPLTWNDRIEGNLLRVGRQSAFDPKYLSHQARYDTQRFLEENYALPQTTKR